MCVLLAKVGIPKFFVILACQRVNILVLVSSAVQISPPVTLVGREMLIFSSLAYFHNPFCKITVFPPLLDALV